VVIATPADLGRKIRIHQPTVRVSYDFNVDLLPLIDRFIDKRVTPQLQGWNNRSGRNASKAL
jgi:predicted GTPase